ncbi:MAG: ArnT family glycosyltransferase [Ardenticatenaceae bacterium]
MGRFVLFVVIGMVIFWLVQLLGVPFHEDEAIYAAWSLRILRGDPWLWVTPVDKPPLTFYPMAASIGLFGRHEWAARLPNVLWTGLLLATLWRIAKHKQASGEFTLTLALFSPLLWAQAASAFTDAAMVALAFLAVERAISGRATQAGVAFGLAFLAKPTALLLAPLVVTTLHFVRGHALVVPRAPRTTKVVTTGGTFSDFLMACAAPLLLAWAWDASRVAPSWWALGAQAYGTLGQMGLGHIEGWGRLALFSLGPLFLVGIITRSNDFSRSIGTRSNDFSRSIATRSNDFSRSALGVTWLLWIPAHMVLGFQAWERYLLPLVPIMALFFALKEAKLDRKGKLIHYWCFILLVPLLIQPFELEPHDGRWQGIAEMGRAIEKLPREAVVYYFDAGRPLAWYAADAQATLLWVQLDQDDEPISWDKDQPSYIVLRTTDFWPATFANWYTVKQSGHFHLLKMRE